MKVSATLRNENGTNHVCLVSDEKSKNISIPPKADGKGSAVSGGEFLFLAIATCFCNDLYREAPAFGISVESVEVSVSGEFPRAGEPAEHVRYQVKINAPGALEGKLQELVEYVDSIAEIHSSIRRGVGVKLIYDL